MNSVHNASAVIIPLGAWVVADAAVIRATPRVARVAVVTATDPPMCSKTFGYVYNGITGSRELRKATHADVYEGDIEVRSVANLSDFAALLTSLGTNQCLTYGVPPRATTKLVTKRKHVEMGQPDTHTPRTADAFSWPAGPGVLMLDYDAPKDGQTPLDRDSLVAAVRAACPALGDAAMLWLPSSSSYIYDAESDKALHGLRGQRLYMLVQNGGDIERAGAVLLDRLWLNGHGRFDVSSSGSLLQRGLFDGSVWQTNRIDFAAGAACTAPIEQRRGDPVLIPGNMEFVDTATAMPDLTDAEHERVKACKVAAKTATGIAAESATKRATWIEKRVAEIVQRSPDVPVEVAREQATRAVERSVLGGDFVLNVEGRVVTVLEVLDNPARYHRSKTLDPLEPDYDGGRRVGILFLFGGRPRLHSKAHGGHTYTLERQPERVLLERGRERDATNAVLAKMQRAPDVFAFGGQIVNVLDGAPQPMTDYTLRFWMSGAMQFYGYKEKKNGEIVEVLSDPPMPICKTVLAVGSANGVRHLTAVITAPTLRPDGSVLSTTGYDEATGLLLLPADDDVVVPVPERPTREQAEQALATLWRPFKEFPFASPLDRAAHLAAVLTAIVRPTLPTVPATGYDAPSPGSGKTLLAKCVSVIATGASPLIDAAPAGRDDEEMRKNIMSQLLAGRRIVVYDNLMGAFNSASFSNVLTTADYSDRLLGKSQTVPVPNRTQFILTGNNLTIASDMTRRILICRIDAATEQTYARSFDLDPEAYCRANRQLLVAAALTLLRFYLTADVPRPGAGRLSSFEAWDDWVRQTVLYVERELSPGQFGDVMDLVDATNDDDPDRETLSGLLVALRGVFGGDGFTTNEVGPVCERAARPAALVAVPEERELADAMKACSGGSLSVQSIGCVLRYRKDKLVGGLKLIRKRSHGVTRWRVVAVGEAAPGRVLPWSQAVDKVRAIGGVG